MNNKMSIIKICLSISQIGSFKNFLNFTFHKLVESVQKLMIPSDCLESMTFVRLYFLRSFLNCSKNSDSERCFLKRLWSSGRQRLHSSIDIDAS